MRALFVLLFVFLEEGGCDDLFGSLARAQTLGDARRQSTEPPSLTRRVRRKMGPENGWWRTVTEAYERPSNVDFCEANFALLDWVAEAGNTLSSFPMCVAGVYGLYRARQCLAWETRWALAWSLLGLVGVGSALFHATLRHLFQALDELPMLYCNLVFVYLMLEEGAGCTRAPRKPWLAPSLVRDPTFAVTRVMLPSRA